MCSSDLIKLKQVWNQLGVNASNLDFWHFNLIDWLSLIGRSNIKMHDMSLPWKMVFPIAIWNIWKSRNAFIFNGKARSPNLVVEIVYQANEYLHCMASPRLEIHKITRYIRWERPKHGWKKLNTNRACMGHHGLAGCGGLVRSADGQWVVGFSKRIGATSSFAAKWWGLREGLRRCCNLNISCLEVEMDAKSIVDVVGNPNYANNIISPILDDCRILITKFHQICIKHCFRQANQCANGLAKKSLRMAADFLIYDSPLVDILYVFEGDLNGMYSFRICPDLSFAV